MKAAHIPVSSARLDFLSAVAALMDEMFQAAVALRGLIEP